MMYKTDGFCSLRYANTEDFQWVEGAILVKLERR